jgi:hypothetical protein
LWTRFADAGARFASLSAKRENDPDRLRENDAGRCQLLGSTPSAERAGFDLPGFCNLCKELCLRLNSRDYKDFGFLVYLLLSHGFLLSLTAI